MGPGEGGDGRGVLRVRRGRALEQSWHWAWGGKVGIRKRREKEPEEPQWCMQSPSREVQGMGEKRPSGKRGGRPGEAGWAVVDIKRRPCWISGSGDGYVPISLSNCQKSNLVSGARAGLGLNGGRQA